jgi:hypothetical protein
MAPFSIYPGAKIIQTDANGHLGVAKKLCKLIFVHRITVLNLS